jgi:hypothetical protein
VTKIAEKAFFFIKENHEYKTEINLRGHPNEVCHFPHARLASLAPSYRFALPQDDHTQLTKSIN